MYKIVTIGIILCSLFSSQVLAENYVTIEKASWESGDNKLKLKGKTGERGNVIAVNAYNITQQLGSDYSDREWEMEVKKPNPIPCRVKVISNNKSIEKDVSNAPANCSPKNPIVIPPNQIPIANVNGPYSGLVNELIQFNSNGSIDNDGTIINYLWDFGDNTTSSNINPTHAYTTIGEYSVKLTVTDNNNATNTSSTTVTITKLNELPIANINGPYNGLVNESIQFSSNGSIDNDGNIVSYLWDFGNGDTSTLENPLYSYTLGGTYTITLTITDNDTASNTSSTTATIIKPNELPIANINGPYSGLINESIQFSSNGSIDNDGNIVSYLWDFGDNITSFNSNPSHVYTTAGNYNVTLTVTDNDNASDSISTNVTITEPIICNATITEHCFGEYKGPETCLECHEEEAREMHGSVHYQQSGYFPNVTNIPKEFITAGEYPAEELGAVGINTYCGSHENSPRFTCAGCHVGNGRYPMAQSVFETLDPNSVEVHKQLSNIDCLMCHQEVYKRFPDWTAEGQGFSDFSLLNLKDVNGVLVKSIGDEVLKTGFSGIPTVNENGDFLFLPAGYDKLPKSVPMPPMSLTTLEAAQLVHVTTRKTCLNCHAGASGSDGAKRGDISFENINPTIDIDMHMSPSGQNLTCSDCHNAGNHRVKGRGLDLRANDVSERFTCESSNCHGSRPHGDFSNLIGSSIDKHTMKIACQTCHIPTYAKAKVGTEVARDWQNPHPSNSACNGRGGWLPNELKSNNITPLYKWFDGTSKVAYLGEPLYNTSTIPLTDTIANLFAGDYTTSDLAYVLGEPNGNSNTGKIYPMKGHWGKLAKDDTNNTLIAHSTFEFFRTGSFCRAVDVGLGNSGDNCSGIPGDLEMPANTSVVPVFTYQTINHGVEVKENALGGDSKQCGSCHDQLTGGPLQVDLSTLGYELRTLPSIVVNTLKTTLNGDINQICSQCHSNKTEGRSFSSVHKRHVQDKKRDCGSCHNFSRLERGLFLTRK